jgi:von Willebrand factor type A domain
MNTVDLLFIVDVTGSMGGFIDDAKKKMQSMLKTLELEHKIDLRVGLSLYRDHPPQDDSFVTVIFDLMSVSDVQKKIEEVQVDGGGDEPEAVIDGIVDGMNGMTWREGSRRIAFLIGDASVHGMIDNESCCQCGNTWGHAVIAAENHHVPIYAIMLSHKSFATDHFRTIANFTGGFLIEGDDAMNVILNTLQSEFDDINLDTKVLEMLSDGKSESDICDMLKIDRDKLNLAASRIAQYS